MAKGEKHTVMPRQRIKEIHRFVYHTPLGYRLRFQDFGSAGIKIELSLPDAPVWDQDTHRERIAAAMLPNEQVEQLLNWLATTSNRKAMALPEKTAACLKRILHTGKITTTSFKILSKMLEVLQNVQKEKSRIQRALNR